MHDFKLPRKSVTRNDHASWVSSTMFVDTVDCQVGTVELSNGTVVTGVRVNDVNRADVNPEQIDAVREYVARAAHEFADIRYNPNPVRVFFADEIKRP